jgi:hypothetical protein
MLSVIARLDGKIKEEESKETGGEDRVSIYETFLGRQYENFKRHMQTGAARAISRASVMFTSVCGTGGPSRSTRESRPYSLEQSCLLAGHDVRLLARSAGRPVKRGPAHRGGFCLGLSQQVPRRHGRYLHIHGGLALQ